MQEEPHFAVALVNTHSSMRLATVILKAAAAEAAAAHDETHHANWGLGLQGAV
jgi:hypothetical protein